MQNLGFQLKPTVCPPTVRPPCISFPASCNTIPQNLQSSFPHFQTITCHVLILFVISIIQSNVYRDTQTELREHNCLHAYVRAKIRACKYIHTSKRYMQERKTEIEREFYQISYLTKGCILPSINLNLILGLLASHCKIFIEMMTTNLQKTQLVNHHQEYILQPELKTLCLNRNQAAAIISVRILTKSEKVASFEQFYSSNWQVSTWIKK